VGLIGQGCITADNSGVARFLLTGVECCYKGMRLSSGIKLSSLSLFLARILWPMLYRTQVLWACSLCVLLAYIAASAAHNSPPKPVSLFMEGDSSSIPKFINVCRQMGPERGLDFQFVDKQASKYDYRVILSTEGSSAWDFAHGNIVVLNPEAKVLFTVTRANRWTSKGTTNAMAKEFVKVMARYLDTHK